MKLTAKQLRRVIEEAIQHRPAGLPEPVLGESGLAQGGHFTKPAKSFDRGGNIYKKKRPELGSYEVVQARDMLGEALTQISDARELLNDHPVFDQELNVVFNQLYALMAKLDQEITQDDEV